MRPFCYAPWTTITIRNKSNDGKISPCCEWSGTSFNGSVDEYFKSKHLKKIKKNMYSGKNISETCQVCINKEKIENASTRKTIYKKIFYGLWNKDIISKVDYRPDNLCNLKCYMCSPRDSSLIENKLIELNKIDPIKNYNTSDIYQLDFSKIVDFKILGGEPTINQKIFDVLDFLIDNNHAKNINLEYTTNCTSINDRWLNRIKNFKNVNTTMSVDATGKCLEYIRTGAKWSTIESNIPKIISSSNDFSFNIVVQAINFLMIEQWFGYFLKYDPRDIMFTSLHRIPGSLNIIPDNIKKEKMNYLKELQHPLAIRALKYFKDSEYDPDEVEKFWKFIEFNDIIWKRDIFKLDNVFTELKKI